MTLTYNTRLVKVKVDPHAKNQGQRSNGSNRRAPTDKRTDTHTHMHPDATTKMCTQGVVNATVEFTLTTPATVYVPWKKNNES